MDVILAAESLQPGRSNIACHKRVSAHIATAGVGAGWLRNLHRWPVSAQNAVLVPHRLPASFVPAVPLHRLPHILCG